MKIPSFLATALAYGMSHLPTHQTTLLTASVTPVLGQIISYTPSEGSGISYSINIPQHTAVNESGPIFFQLTAPPPIQWIALGQGARMVDGNLFIVYAGLGGNITLSTRQAKDHVEPKYNSNVDAFLLDGSGFHHGNMTANIQCNNCMRLFDGRPVLGPHSDWIWAMAHGEPIMSSNVTHPIPQHDWHGIFTLNLTEGVGGETENPFLVSSHTIIDHTFKSPQQQISDARLHKKRIAHGVITSVAFVLLFPNFALTLYILPSRWTVPAIHAPLQIFAVALALAGYAIGFSVAHDLQEGNDYHPLLGHIAVLGVAVPMPILGIIQHLRFRKYGLKTIWGVMHRYLGRFLIALGIINGGVGFHYAIGKNPNIPPASPIAYGIICASVGMIYVFVIYWRRSKTKAENAAAQVQAQAQNGSDDTLVEKKTTPVQERAVESTSVSTVVSGPESGSASTTTLNNPSTAGVSVIKEKPLDS